MVERSCSSGRKRIPRPSSFYSSIYAEIEDIGWEHLVRSEADLSSLTFRVCDEQGRAHYMELSLPETYPKHAPSVSTDMPSHFKLNWSVKAKLKDVLEQFRKHLEKLKTFWSTLEEIDRALCVVDPILTPVVSSTRLIMIGDNCKILLSLTPLNPKQLPECRFLGLNPLTDVLRKNWRKNQSKWLADASREPYDPALSINLDLHSMHLIYSKLSYDYVHRIEMPDKPFPQNLATLLEIKLPGPPADVKGKETDEIECGICYSQYLPIDDELGTSSGCSPDYACENPSCRRAFHSLCLRDWLRSITTTRQSFDVLFGSCPYCSEAIAVKINEDE